MAKRFKRLIVHVGMHKTGSTTLQQMLRRMRWEGAGPLDMIDANHSVGCSLWFGSVLEHERSLLNLGHDRASAERHLARVKARVAKQLATSKREELVISAEWLSDGRYQGEGRIGALRRLKDQFEPHFERIEIYGYVRPPRGYITSACQELMKMRPFFKTPWPEYKRRFGPLRRVFGPEHVHLRVFDPARLQSGDVIADFREWVGWPQKTFKISPTNTRMSAAAAALTYCYQINRAPIQSLRDRRETDAVVAKLTRLGGPDFALSGAVTDALIDENAADLAWMEKILQTSLSENDRADTAFAVHNADDLIRNAARFAPMLWGDAPQEPPVDPKRADRMAWDALRQRFML